MGRRPGRVSVVLPTYNRADVLERSVESVLGQTFQEYELLIVDDASTDETDAVVDGFDDDRIRYIKHDENRGAAAARNTGIREAGGEIIAFQDSDDVWHERKLEKQVATLEDRPEDVGVVYTGARREFDDSETYIPGDGVEPKEGDIEKSLLSFNFVTTQAAAVRQECFETVGTLDEKLPALVDWELWIRISEFYEFAYVDEPLVTAYLREDSISNDAEALVDARERIVERHCDRFDTETLARQRFWVGNGAMKLGDTNRGRRNLLRAFTTDPRLLYLGAFAISLLGSAVYRSAREIYKE